MTGACYLICEHGLKFCGSLLDLTSVELNFRGSLPVVLCALDATLVLDSGDVWTQGATVLDLTPLTLPPWIST